MLTKFFPEYVTGVNVYIYNVSKELKRRGHDVSILTSDLGDYYTRERITSSKEYFNGLPIHRFIKVIHIPLSPTLYVEDPLSLMFSIKRLSPEVIHAHDITGALLSKLCSKVPVFCTVQTLSKGRFPNQPTLQSVSGFFDKYAFRMLDAIIAYTERQRHFLVREMNLLPSKVFKIPIGINVEEFSRGNQEAFHKKYGIKSRYVVLYVGRLAPNKGLESLVLAIPYIVSEFPETTFVFIGRDEGDVKNRLVSLARGLHIERYLVFLGSLPEEDKINAYMACDVFVFPSIEEQFGIPVIEAMAAGKPVVATETGVAVEVIEDGLNGFLVKPLNSQAIAKAIKVSLFDGALRKRSEQVNKKLVREYNWEKVVDKLEKVYFS